MKTCPACAEQIQEAAILCRYCRTRLGGADRRAMGFGRVLVIGGLLGLAVSLVAPAVLPNSARLPAARESACPAVAPGRWLPPGHPPIDGLTADRPLRLPLELGTPGGVEGVREL